MKTKPYSVIGQIIDVLSCAVSTYLHNVIDCVSYNVTCKFTVNLDSIIA